MCVVYALLEIKIHCHQYVVIKMHTNTLYFHLVCKNVHTTCFCVLFTGNIFPSANWSFVYVKNYELFSTCNFTEHKRYLCQTGNYVYNQCF